MLAFVCAALLVAIIRSRDRILWLQDENVGLMTLMNVRKAHHRADSMFNEIKALRAKVRDLEREVDKQKALVVSRDLELCDLRRRVHVRGEGGAE